ncbi:hypothetical protein C9374_013981 [Naegleria lovaniensis]|uniref:Uncharacterized protein n=1 Tax=Naegleria lovaniensis TaxID=51637 RepID=A0AA88H0H0_NAELO|nr:uncharacterized protein C9374_013981 [Naegleria lovaniensis]KAG2389421.1 hypothetical protein C9374_013981 [Naegleria lovaniensis]
MFVQFLIDQVLYVFYKIIDTFQPQSKYCVLGYSKTLVYESSVFKELQDLFKKSFGDGESSKESLVETLYSYSIEFRNFYMCCYDDVMSHGYFTNNEIYNYYIKGNSGLIFTIDFSQQFALDIEEWKNRLFVLFSIIHTHSKNKIPMLFIVYGNDLCNNSDVQLVTKTLKEFIQRWSYEEYSCIVEKEKTKDGALYEGLEWLMSFNSK